MAGTQPYNSPQTSSALHRIVTHLAGVEDPNMVHSLAAHFLCQDVIHLMNFVCQTSPTNSNLLATITFNIFKWKCLEKENRLIFIFLSFSRETNILITIVLKVKRKKWIDLMYILNIYNKYPIFKYVYLL